MEYPVIHNPGSIELLLDKLHSTQSPRVVDYDFLTTLGFKREVDESLLMLLGFLGFIDDNNQPTILWEKSHDPDKAKVLLGKAVKAAYGSLFKAHPEAVTEEGSVLMEFFRSSSGASDPDAAYMILSFKVLCDLAEFSEKSPIEQKKHEKKPIETKKTSAAKLQEAKSISNKATSKDSPPVIRLSINIDIEESDLELRNLALKLIRKQLEL
ncbi:MAG: DUF5343 domain-containing protein [Candidatus Aegiribacteria sp.]|nr:DUF5343 domain-containing protein [Candidatus Aegiribacteria sp.]